MQAILTNYRGATDNKGARITAKSESGKVTIPFRSNLSLEDNHRQAAHILCKSLGWPADLIGGSTPDGYAFIFRPENEGSDKMNTKLELTGSQTYAWARKWPCSVLSGHDVTIEIDEKGDVVDIISTAATELMDGAELEAIIEDHRHLVNKEQTK